MRPGKMFRFGKPKSTLTRLGPLANAQLTRYFLCTSTNWDSKDGATPNNPEPNPEVYPHQKQPPNGNGKQELARISAPQLDPSRQIIVSVSNSLYLYAICTLFV
jgi:hypothetical protein